MDIRNIKESAPKIEDGRHLEAIWGLQKKLLKGYIGKIEKDLPEYPIDIHSFNGQQVLKDFSARIIEETAEGYESTTLAFNILSEVNYNVNLLNANQWQSILNHLQNSNEEQADATAFYICLFLYANVDISDIYDYCNKVINKGLDSNVSSLQDIMELGNDLLRYHDDYENRYNLFPDDETLKAMYYQPEIVRGYIPAFHSVSEFSHVLEGNMLWEVTYHINIGRNFLKNKPWKQTQELTDVTRYDEQIILGFVKYMGYLRMQGFDPDKLYNLFFKKHKVNLFRQKSGY